MKVFSEKIKEFKHDIESVERIWVAKHALNMAPDINKRDFLKIVRTGEQLEVIREDFQNNQDIRETKPLEEIIENILHSYENRTIQIEREEINYSRVVEILKSFDKIDGVAGYRHWLFEPLSMELWQHHKLKEDTRMVLYIDDLQHREQYKEHGVVSESKRAVKIIKDVAKELGSLVADKRKKYMKYALHTYLLNDMNGLHMRPASQIVNFLKKYEGDIWIRTEDMEVNARSIFALLKLAATHDKKLTICYKPAQDSHAFYKELGNLKAQGKNLLTRVE